jgi:mannose-6-phosphate isomerase-like protein (cupin superfamily)
MRLSLAVLASAVVLGGCAPALTLAQSPAAAAASTPPLSNAVQILPASRLAAIADSLPPGAIHTQQIARFEGLTNALNRRDSSGVHERHLNFTDIFVVQRGSARLLYGGTVDGERETSPGEWRGGTIRNGSRADLRPGDVVVIPAGIPHQMLLNPGEQIVYLSFKVAKLPR